MKIAWFSPLPPARSGIADHSAELLPYLAAYADITLFADEPEQVDRALAGRFAVRPSTAYPQEQWQYDLPLYHIGNSAHHETIYRMALRYPGVVVLHEVGLHHFVADRTLGRHDRAAYIREMGYAQGAAGLPRIAQVAEGRLEDFADLPLSNRLADASLGLIVHSRYARERVRGLRPYPTPYTLPIQIIPELMAPQSGQPRLRQELSWPDDALVFASLGQVTPLKQPGLALRAFSRLVHDYPQARYLIIGEQMPDADLQPLIAELRLAGQVHITGYVETMPAFVNWLLLADVVVNLRHPTLGETSAAALRALAAAKPLIVFDHGWYSELPDTAVLKTPPLDEATLLATMQRLAESASRRQQMGQAGLAYIRDNCAPEKAAAAYSAFLRQIVAQYGARDA